jgi:tRNA-dihydrouridine synthase B
MGSFKQPFQLGKLTLPSNVFCAPLAGCSDLPFRKMTTSYQPGLVFCEMVKMDALVRHDPHTFRLLDFETGMHPIGAQICGSKPQIAGKCAKIVEDLGFDVVDLNCGCPVDKVTKDGSGSGMLKTPELIGEILCNMIAAVDIPVTVKIRAGWDSESINAVQITEIAEKAGATAICIHGRTRAQGYKGPANWDYIRECKQKAKNIIVIGNGDVFDAASAEKMFSFTGCDAILISRGTLGQPWIIEDIYRKFKNQPPLLRTSTDLRDALLQHFQYTLAYQIERKAILDMRRISCWYLKKGKTAKTLRESLIRAKTMKEIEELIINCPWDEMDGAMFCEAEDEVTCEV